MRVGLRLGIGLVHGVELGDEGVVLGRRLIRGIDKGEHGVSHKELAGDLAAEADDVGVEDATGIERARHVTDEGAAGTGHLVDGVGDADTGAAEHHTQVGAAARHGLAHGLTVDGVMGSRVAVRAEVQHGMAGLLEAVVQIGLLIGHDVVAAQCDDHSSLLGIQADRVPAGGLRPSC